MIANRTLRLTRDDTIYNMIVGVDIGGTKTLVAALTQSGEISREVSFATPADYDAFLDELQLHANKISVQPTAICAGVPGLLNRSSGIVHSLGNLPWVEKPIAQDIAKAFGVSSALIENDSKLAGLSEVRSLRPTPKRALYITVSTGIGGALVVNGRLSDDVIDMELGKAPLMFEGTLQHWEDFASGRAFFAAYGKQGDDVGDDPALWDRYVADRLGPGIAVACSYLQVDTIILGGGLGHHSSHFSQYLEAYLDQALHAIVARPKKIVSARHGKNAVIYGCYEYAKDRI